jgi:hypothetical protein
VTALHCSTHLKVAGRSPERVVCLVTLGVLAHGRIAVAVCAAYTHAASATSQRTTATLDLGTSKNTTAQRTQ